MISILQEKAKNLKMKMKHTSSPPFKGVPFYFGLSICLALPFLHSTALAFEFKNFCFDGRINGLFYLQGDKEISLEISSYRISKPYNYKGESPLVFQTYTMDANGEKVRTPVAQFPFDPRLQQVLLLFSPVPAGGFQVYPIANDPANHPPGAYRIQNLAPSTIAFQINRKVYEFPTQHAQILSPPPPPKETITIDFEKLRDDGGNLDDTEDEEEEDPPKRKSSKFADNPAEGPDTIILPSKIPVQMAVRMQDGKWDTIYNRKWLYRPDIRTYIFAYPAYGSVTLKQFIEFLR